MTDRAPMRLAWLLSALGIMPFLVSAAWLWLGPPEHAAVATQALVAYAVAVLSFLGGIQWGLGIAVAEQAPKSSQSLFLLSAVPIALAWTMLFISTAGAKLVVAIFLFGFVWVIDALLHLQKLIPAWFLKLRTAFTGVALASLVAALLRF